MTLAATKFWQTNTMTEYARRLLILKTMLAISFFSNSSANGFQLKVLDFRKGELLGVEKIVDDRYAIVAQRISNRVFITTATLSPETLEIDVPKGPRLYLDRPVMSVSTTTFKSKLYLGLILHNGNAERLMGRFSDKLELRLYKCGETRWEKILSCDLARDAGTEIADTEAGATASLSLEGLSDSLRLIVVHHNRINSVNIFDLREASPLPELNIVWKSFPSASHFSVKSDGASLAFCSLSDFDGKAMANICINVGNKCFTTSEGLTHSPGRCIVSTMKSGESVFAFVNNGDSRVELFHYPKPTTSVDRSRKVILIDPDSELLDIALNNQKALMLLKKRNIVRVESIDLRTLEIEAGDVRETETAVQQPIFSKIDTNLLYLQWQDMKIEPHNSNLLIDSILQLPKT